MFPKNLVIFYDPHAYDDEKIGQIFYLCTPEVAYADRKVVGKYWLVENADVNISNMISHFLTICMDFLLDVPMVWAMADTFMISSFYSSNNVDFSLSLYNFDYVLLPYNGFLPITELLANGWSRELLFVAKCGLIGDCYEDTLVQFERLIGHVPPLYLVVALDVFTGIHSLLEIRVAISGSPHLAEPLQMIPPPLSGDDVPRSFSDVPPDES